jgi:hypothetical protein
MCDIKLWKGNENLIYVYKKLFIKTLVVHPKKFLAKKLFFGEPFSQYEKTDFLIPHST